MSSSQSLLSLVGFIPELIIFIACINFMVQSKSSESKLLFTGALVGMLVRLFYVLIPYLMLTSDYQSTASYYTLAGAIGLIGRVLFCVGLVLLIQRVLGNRK
jgi:hypothetical protein